MIALGPVASKLAIKMLGTDVGGFFYASSADPSKNPGAICYSIQMLGLFVLGAGLTLTFGKAVGNIRQGWAILASMMPIFLGGVAVVYAAETAGKSLHHALGVAGSNIEGKEVRFGVAASSLFATITTDTSTGAVIAAHDSLMPLGGLIPTFNTQLGELVVGGVGSGLYAVLVYAILAVLITGLMVGRTPEYIGKGI